MTTSYYLVSLSLSLSLSPSLPSSLQPIILKLKDTVATETSLIVCCHALDAMFDILGHDNCPPELKTIDLLVLLQTANKTLRTQVSNTQLMIPSVTTCKIRWYRLELHI